MKNLLLLTAILMGLPVSFQAKAQQKHKKKIDIRIDNMKYWKKMAEQGLVPVAPARSIPQAHYKGSGIQAKSVNTDDSPDIPVNDDGNNTQSENAVFVNPTDNAQVLNSNNSTTWSGGSVGNVYGADYLYTNDYALTWGGNIQGAGENNSGDPATAISLDGSRHYIGFINNNSGQSVSYSTDAGNTWNTVVAGNASGSMLDKNHLWIDNSPSSPYEGNVYDAWTDFGGSIADNIGFVYSTDGGASFSTPVNISAAVNAGSHNQGVNLQTGPNGEVYAVWTIYDSFPSDETAIGFAKSSDGGVSFEPATRIISNIRGIRNSGVSKNQRVNSFPVMAVDISGGENNGNIYVVWTNVGIPGTNTGTNRSVYLIKSTDKGTTWSNPVRVNQGTFADGKEAYLPWITCDPENGILSVIFYDDRNVNSTEVETWVANSYDGGDTWEDFKVSDVAFTPTPISGLADGYMGDYLGISARGGMVYPTWADNRNAYVQTFVSPFETNNRDKPANLNINLTFATGQTDLTWTYNGAKNMQYFVIYRDNVQIGTSNTTSFTDNLPDYGIYTYSVTAMHEDGESSAARNSIQWGDPHIEVIPGSLTETLQPSQTSVRVLTVYNTGELDLTYNINTVITSAKDTNTYCSASGGGNDEYISGVEIGTISNTGTPQSNYADYTNLSTEVETGNTYTITITSGEHWDSDDLGIWVDWNQDQDFDDPGEQVYCGVNMGGEGSFEITVPDNALNGSTRMRIRQKYSGDDCGSPCGTTSYGEVEDYTLDVNAWIHTDSGSGIILPGQSEQINVNFDASDLTAGDYFATITFNSNATGQPQLDVPVTLHVVNNTNLQSNASADDYSVCEGSSTTLHANPVGGSGNYTFTWTSVPSGFSSTEENPAVSPTENTVYTVVVSDGTDTVSSNVSITVQNNPVQANTPSGDTELCQDADNSTYTTDPVDGALSYEWSLNPATAGSIFENGTSAEINWDASFTGTVQISVSGVNNCGNGTASTPLTVNVYSLPEVSLSTFDDVCSNTPAFPLTGGTPEGGTYSGPGVSNNEFDPSSSGVGTFTITYTYTNDNGCEGIATQNITVNPVPVVTLSNFESVYDYEPGFELTGGTPEGGTYSGTGVSNGYFYPGIAGAGTHTITYTYTGDYECENYAESNIEVISSLDVDNIHYTTQIHVYPNPSRNVLYVSLHTRKAQTIEISIVNQLGIKLLTNQPFVSDDKKIALKLDYINAGVYYVQVKDEKTYYVRKFIIQK